MLPASTLTRMDPGIMNVCSESMGWTPRQRQQWGGLGSNSSSKRGGLGLGRSSGITRGTSRAADQQAVPAALPASPHNHQPLPAGRCALRAAGPPRVLHSFGGTAPACAVLPSARQRNGVPPATGAAAPRCRWCRTQARAALCTGGSSEWKREGRMQRQNTQQTMVCARPCCVRQCRQDCPPAGRRACCCSFSGIFKDLFLTCWVAVHTTNDCPPASCSRLGRREKISTMRVRAAT